MLDAKAYCDEIFSAAKRVFERRGFVWVEGHVAAKSTSLAHLANNSAGWNYRADVYLEEKRAGIFKLHFRRYQRMKRMEDGTKRSSHYPLKNELFLEVLAFRDGLEYPSEETDVAHKRHTFVRGIPGNPGFVMLDSNGRFCGGRPKVRRWATYAAHALAIHHTNTQVQYIHDQ